jgi:hypothetical protein
MFSDLYEQVKTTFVNVIKPREDTLYPDSSKVPQFHDYKERSIIGLDRPALQQRKQTLDIALSGPIGLGKLQTTTRDMYLKGPVERYDFCTELLDSTPGPFPLECLQNEFIRQGGQRTGSLYPSQTNLAHWNSKKKWLHVKQEIENIITATLDTRPIAKEEAMKGFYGVGLGQPAEPIAPQEGVEIFWFSHHTDITMPTTFLGRRIRSMIPYLNTNTFEPGSVVFFTSLITDKWSQSQFRVNSLNGFSLYFNSHMTRVYNNKMESNANELASLHNGGNATSTSNVIPMRPDINRLSGYLYYGKGITYYKLEAECPEFGPGWKEIPRGNLQLVQEPFAPMVSFEIERSPQTWGCDYPLCDRRFGGFKMKWEQDGWGGPSLQFRGESVDQMQFPLRKNYMSFPSSKCSIKSKFSLHYSSFMTLTMLITIRSCPKTNEISLPFTFTGNTGCALFTRHVSEKEVTLNIGSLDGKIATSDGPVLRRSVPTLIVFRVLRKNEMDPASINGIQIGAAELGDLQKVPETRKVLRQSSPLVLSGLTSNDPLYLRIQSENMAFDLFWIHMFDYKIENELLYREARADWGYLPSI